MAVHVAVSSDFQFYSGGVFTGAYGSTLNHVMLAVGYGMVDGMDYYKLRNLGVRNGARRGTCESNGRALREC